MSLNKVYVIYNVYVLDITKKIMLKAHRPDFYEITRLIMVTFRKNPKAAHQNLWET